MNRKLIIILTVLISAVSVSFGEYKLQTKLTSTDLETNDHFGDAVSIFGNYAVVGDYTQNNSRGAVYIYKFDGTNWGSETKLLPPSLNSDYGFGYSVAADSNRIVIGIYSSDVNEVYVYDHNGISWGNEPIILRPNERAEKFGVSVDIDDDTIVVGAYADDNEKGAAYVFEFISGGWQQVKKLIASDGLGINTTAGRFTGDRFGWSVAIDSNRIVVGSYMDDIDNQMNQNYFYDRDGSVYVFEKNNGIWPATENTKLFLSQPIAEYLFGYDVDISGDVIVTGARWYNGEYSHQGAAFLYEWDGNSWVETLLNNPSPAINDQFGFSVAIDEKQVIVGAPWKNYTGTASGAVYSFEKNGSLWSNAELVVNSSMAADSYFGWDMSIENNRILSGAPFEDGTAENSGSAYIFHNEIRTPPMYVVTKLSEGGFLYGLNNNGQAVGKYGSQSLFWDKGATEILDLTTIECHDSSRFLAVNDYGTMVGYSSGLLCGIAYNGFIWKNGTLTILKPLEGENELCAAEAINNNGVIAGWMQIDGFNGFRPCIWLPGDANAINIAAGINVDYCKAFAINDHNQVVGYYNQPGSDSIDTAFIYDIENGWKDIPLLNAGGTRASCINNNSQIVGNASGSGWEKAFFYDDNTEVIRTLSPIEGTANSRAFSINDDGFVVGRSFNTISSSKPGLWIDDNVYDLNNYLIDSSWTITTASRINNNGKIVAYGVHGGVEYAVLLSPVGRLDNDSDVDLVDMAVFSANWQKTDCNDINNWCSNSDINRDGKVDEVDLVNLCQQWLSGVE